MDEALFRSIAGQSISHGTLRDLDLIPAFTNALESLDKERVEYPRWAHADAYALCDVANRNLADPTDDGHAALAELTVALMERLEEIAPEGYYFGAIEGDGSDFGFWPVPSDEEDEE